MVMTNKPSKPGNVGCVVISTSTGFPEDAAADFAGFPAEKPDSAQAENIEQTDPVAA